MGFWKDNFDSLKVFFYGTSSVEKLNKGINYTSKDQYWELFSEIYQATVSAIPETPLAPPAWKEYYKT